MQRREGCLRVEIDRQNPVAVQGQILGEVRGCRGLARAAFEVDGSQYLAMLCPVSPRGIALALAALVEHLADLVNLRQCVGAASTLPRLRLWAFAAQRQLPKIAVGDADETSSFAGGEAAQHFLRDRREQRLAQRLQFLRQRLAVTRR